MQFARVLSRERNLRRTFIFGLIGSILISVLLKFSNGEPVTRPGLLCCWLAAGLRSHIAAERPLRNGV